MIGRDYSFPAPQRQGLRWSYVESRRRMARNALQIAASATTRHVLGPVGIDQRRSPASATPLQSLPSLRYGRISVFCCYVGQARHATPPVRPGIPASTVPADSVDAPARSMHRQAERFGSNISTARVQASSARGNIVDGAATMLLLPVSILRDPGRAPAVLAQAFQRMELRLVGHLAAVGDPIAEIDIGHTGQPRPFDQAQDHEGA